MKKFLIEVQNDPPGFNCFIDEVVLTGNEEELTYRINIDMEFVNSLNIHESFYHNKFKLIDEEHVDFPDYKI